MLIFLSFIFLSPFPPSLSSSLLSSSLVHAHVVRAAELAGKCDQFLHAVHQAHIPAIGFYPVNVLVGLPTLIRKLQDKRSTGTALNRFPRNIPPQTTVTLAV